MQSKRIYFWGVGIILSLFISSGCNDIIVPDISNDSVDLVLPQDGFSTTTQTHTFWWNPLEDADGYELRIISPSFDSITSLHLDTLILENKFDFTLPAGIYEWQISAYNDAYFSLPSIRQLVIEADPTEDLANQIINLQSPSNALQTMDSIVVFTWDALTNAGSYLFQLGDANFTNILFEDHLTGTTFRDTFEFDGQYFWRVRGIHPSNETMTPWSTADFTLDRVAPEPATLSLPINMDTIDIALQNPDLKWINSEDTEMNVLLIYADEMEDILLFETTVTNAQFNLENSSIDFETPTIIEDYFWKVISIDQAGNESEPSELRTFYVE